MPMLMFFFPARTCTSCSIWTGYFLVTRPRGIQGVLWVADWTGYFLVTRPRGIQGVLWVAERPKFCRV
jgi:hypothetical protein